MAFKSSAMKSTSVGTFLYLGDRNVSNVSIIWKSLHISIYIAIAINSFVTSMASGNLFQTFKYNCILYCTDLTFKQDVLPQDFTIVSSLVKDSHMNNPDDDLDSIEQGVEGLMMDNTSLLVNDTKIANGTDKSNALQQDKSETNNKENQTELYRNVTHVFQSLEDGSVAVITAKIDLRKSIFPANFWCNFVLGIALVTFIFAAFCTILMAMCSKGGKGQNNTLNRPQNMIYPILISSVILLVLNLVAAVVVKSGMKEFCASFKLFTGDESCSPGINKFTLHERQGNFYLPYLVLSHVFDITTILFAGQILVTFLRVIYAVDYQLYELEVESVEQERKFEIEDGKIVECTL